MDRRDSDRPGLTKGGDLGQKLTRIVRDVICVARVQFMENELSAQATGWIARRL